MSPIQINYDSTCTANEFATAGTWRPLTICDYCGERIESAGNCSVEHHEDVPEPAFCHKDRLCHEKLRRSRHTLAEVGWGWMEMRRWISAVSANL